MAARKKTGNVFIAALFLLFAGSISAQKVTLKSDVISASPGDPVTISVYSNVKGHISIDLPLDFQPDYGVVRTSENKMDHATGKVEKNYILRQPGSFSKAGTYSFYAYVNYKGRNVQSNKITIRVSKAGNPADYVVKTNDPVYGFIQTKKKSVYEGEATLVSSKVVSRLEIFKIKGYNPYDFENNTEKHPFQNQPTDFKRTTVNGRSAFVVEHDKMLTFPVTVGKNRIHPFEMSLRYHDSYLDKQITIKSAAAQLIVKPLPNGAPADFIGAVGNFGISLANVKNSINAGDPFTITLVVTGLGNLHNITDPVLKLPNGCSVYGDPNRKESYVFTDEGAQGTITFTYDIKIIGGGDFIFPPQSISWFDPDSEDYKSAETEGFTLTVKGGSTAQANTPAGLKSKPKTGGLKKSDESSETLTFIVVIGIALALVLLLIFLLNRKPKSAHQKAPEKRIKLSEVESPVQQVAIQKDAWTDVTASTSDPERFARLLPEAIIAEVNRKTGSSYFSREKALGSLLEEQRLELREIMETCDRYRYGTAADLSPIALLQRAKKALT